MSTISYHNIIQNHFTIIVISKLSDINFKAEFPKPHVGRMRWHLQQLKKQATSTSHSVRLSSFGSLCSTKNI